MVLRPIDASARPWRTAGRGALLLASVLLGIARGASPAPAQCPITGSQIEGPYYIAGSPETNDLALPGDGPLLTLGGRVLDTDCQPIPFCWIDVWHTDTNGAYDNSGVTYTYRGHFFTDADGEWVLHTIEPGLYPGRTRHIHVKVEGDNTPLLTTQLYFPGEPLNASDSFYDPELEVTVLSEAPNGDRVATFDFALTSTCTAPTVAQDPSPLAVVAGDAAQFTIVATGSATLGYQWRREGLDLADGPGVSGSATSALLLSAVDVADTGDYDCVIANSCGSATSAAADLVVGSGSGLFVRSDCNADGGTDVADPIANLTYLFAAGAAPPCLDACDANDDGSLDVADAVYALLHLFGGAATPAPPFPGCGIDPTADAVNCGDFPPCP